MEALTYMPLTITSLALAVISFTRIRPKNNKIKWLITATILWVATLLWTVNKLGVFKF